MLTLTSAKRIILLLVGLNVATILTAVTIFSSGMLVANASQLIATCSINSTQLSKFKLNGDYSGTLANRIGKPLDSMNITFQTVKGKVTPSNFTASEIASDSKPLSSKQGGGIGMHIGGGDISVGTDSDGNQFAPEDPTEFTIATTDQTNGNGKPVIIDFQITKPPLSNSPDIDGTWTVTNKGSTYDGFRGTFKLNPQSDSNS